MLTSILIINQITSFNNDVQTNDKQGIQPFVFQLNYLKSEMLLTTHIKMFVAR